MTYIELTGLPGAGKSTLFKSLDNQKHSKVCGTIFPRPGIKRLARGEFDSDAQISFGELLRSCFLDSWSTGTILEFPELFSRILSLASLVPVESRQRAIVMNYWRDRVANYYLFSQLPTDRVSIVDEGMAQTLLSTVIRAKSLTPQGQDSRRLVNRVVESFPPVDAVVNLRISAENIRIRSASSSHWAISTRTTMWLDLILDALRLHGVPVVEIDGDRAPERVRADFEALDIGVR